MIRERPIWRRGGGATFHLDLFRERFDRGGLLRSAAILVRELGDGWGWALIFELEIDGKRVPFTVDESRGRFDESRDAQVASLQAATRLSRKIRNAALAAMGEEQATR